MKNSNVLVDVNPLEGFALDAATLAQILGQADNTVQSRTVLNANVTLAEMPALIAQYANRIYEGSGSYSPPLNLVDESVYQNRASENVMVTFPANLTFTITENPNRQGDVNVEIYANDCVYSPPVGSTPKGYTIAGGGKGKALVNKALLAQNLPNLAVNYVVRAYNGNIYCRP